MPTPRLKARAATRQTLEADAAFREDFVTAVSHIGLCRDEAAALVESACGQSFEACRPAELVPVLATLLALVRSANTQTRLPCRR